MLSDCAQFAVHRECHLLGGQKQQRQALFACFACPQRLLHLATKCNILQPFEFEFQLQPMQSSRGLIAKCIGGFLKLIAFPFRLGLFFACVHHLIS